MSQQLQHCCQHPERKNRGLVDCSGNFQSLAQPSRHFQAESKMHWTGSAAQRGKKREKFLKNLPLIWFPLKWEKRLLSTWRAFKWFIKSIPWVLSNLCKDESDGYPIFSTVLFRTLQEIAYCIQSCAERPPFICLIPDFHSRTTGMSSSSPQPLLRKISSDHRRTTDIFTQISTESLMLFHQKMWSAIVWLI